MFDKALKRLFGRLGFKTCLSKTKTKTKTCLSKTKTKTKTKTQQFQDQDQDQDSAVSRPRQDQDSAVSRPRPRPRLWCPRPRPRLMTYKTNTGTPWLGWTVTNKRTEKVMAGRKSSIPVVAYSKQQNIIPCLTTVLFWQLPLIIAVYQTLARTHEISKLQCFIDS